MHPRRAPQRSPHRLHPHPHPRRRPAPAGHRPHPAHIEGGNTAWASPGALGGSPVRRSRAPVLLGPFDDLLWHRPRVHGLFGFTHVFEACKPAARRVHGYYVCPLLAGGRLIGRADLARHDGTLTIHRVTLEPHATATGQTRIEVADGAEGCAAAAEREHALGTASVTQPPAGAAELVDTRG
ncbi:crosslink repair DNA glycosylase YcaQ family protein [Streptomyces sp. NPDC048551]|uniref:DNA glycosylase AlkZ-like family protein n=1 Tax=Streptomyces sp. NPDC048551 TaxID=3155758 RepID=UPI0034279EB6